MSLYFDDDYQTLDQWFADVDSLIVRLQEAIEEPSMNGGSEFIEKHAHDELAAMVRAFEKLRFPKETSIPETEIVF